MKWSELKKKIYHMLYLQFERDEWIKYEIFPKIRIIRSVRRYLESLWWKRPVLLSSCHKDFPNDNGKDGFRGFHGFFFSNRTNKIKIKWNKMNHGWNLQCFGVVVSKTFSITADGTDYANCAEIAMTTETTDFADFREIFSFCRSLCRWFCCCFLCFVLFFWCFFFSCCSQSLI